MSVRLRRICGAQFDRGVFRKGTTRWNRHWQFSSLRHCDSLRCLERSSPCMSSVISSWPRNPACLWNDFPLDSGRQSGVRNGGDTEYRLSIIPLGGYVKMYGEDLDAEIRESERERSFQHQSVWRRIPIVAAGPAFNIFFAVALIACVQVVGYPVEQSVHIGRILEGSGGSRGWIASGATRWSA